MRRPEDGNPSRKRSELAQITKKENNDDEEENKLSIAYMVGRRVFREFEKSIILMNVDEEPQQSWVTLSTKIQTNLRKVNNGVIQLGKLFLDQGTLNTT